MYAGMDEEKSSLMSLKNFEKRFGQSPVFVASTLLENGGVPHSASPGALLKEAIHVISCGYEDKTDWGKEVVFISLFLACLQHMPTLIEYDSCCRVRLHQLTFQAIQQKQN